jgi:hypothetical protein
MFYSNKTEDKIQVIFLGLPNAKGVASPVVWYTQMLIAKPLICEPKIDNV